MISWGRTRARLGVMLGGGARAVSRRPIALAFALLCVGVILGVALQRAHLPARLLNLASAKLESAAPTEPQSIQWRTVSSNRHQLQVASIRVWDELIPGGSLTQMGDAIVMASPQGRLSYLDARNVMHGLDADIRMNLEALRNDPLYDDPRFDWRSLRTHDLLALQVGPDSFELYASFDRFSGACVDFIVARLAVRATRAGLEPIGRWADVWTARPCLRWRDRGPLLAQPSMAGGRMHALGQDEILITVGDRHRDGYYDSEALAMNPNVDYGKLVLLNVRSGSTRHYASGLRNALGLTVDNQGRIWETENGPQGGDELNLIVDGGNYGWPIVTYGMAYGSPPHNWPANPTIGGHAGYPRPRFAFVPSIGIGNVVVPDPDEFPNWDDSLLIGSLRAQSLFVVLLDGDDVVFAEPIPLQYRLRDMISLNNGQLAILTDERGLLLLVRNAEGRDDPAPLVVSGFASLPALSPEELLHAAGQDPVSEGRAYFAAACARCHSVASEIGVGPPLNGVVDRDIASVQGFGYSPALTALEGSWTETRLERFIDHPQTEAPGTAMPVTALPIPWANRIVRYLRTTRAEH